MIIVRSGVISHSDGIEPEHDTMSRDLGDDWPQRPSGSNPRPKAKPLAPGDHTFQPSVAGPTATGAAKKTKRAGGEPREVTSGGPGWVERIVFGSVSSDHLAKFCGQFGTYQDAGVDLLRSLASLERQFARTALGPVIGRMETAVRGGDTLTETMTREPRAFDKLCLAMIRVAEARGGVPETLKLLSRHYEARHRMIRQARSALIYPSIVLTLASVVVLLMSIYILPIFAAMLSDLARGGKAELPFPSRVLMALSGFMTSHGWWLVPTLVITTVVLAVRWYATDRGKEALDGLSMYIPVLGKIRRKIETGRFARTLAALLNAGVDIGSSLKLTGRVLALPAYRRAVEGTRSLVVDGTELSAALDQSGRFGVDVVAIVESGEESGRIPEALDKLADDYEEQVEHMVRNLGQLIQPIMMVAMGGVVLFVILAVLLPYIQALSALAG